MESQAKLILDTSDERTQALLRGQSQQHASMWKHATHTPEMFIPGDLFRIMGRYSIGRAILSNPHNCPSCGETSLDPYGDHALICMPMGDVVHRHNDIYRVLITEARLGMISLSVEDTILKTAKSTYRADFLIPTGIPRISDRPTAFDVVVTCPLNQTLVKRAAANDLASADAAEKRKYKEQKEDLEKLGYGFVPVPFETTGGHTALVATLVHYLAQQKAIMTGIPFAENVTRLWELLSVTLQRANAFAIKRRYLQLLPTGDPMLAV